MIPEEITSTYARRWGVFHPAHHWGTPRHHDDSEDLDTLGRGVLILYPKGAEALVRSTDGRTRRGKLCRRVRTACEAYHAAFEAARQDLGVWGVEEARWEARQAVLGLGFRTAEIPARTLAGLQIKGRAGLAMHRAWASDPGFHVKPEPTYARLLENLAVLDVGESV